MKVITAKKMATMLIVLIPLGISSNLLAENTQSQVQESDLTENTIEEEFSSLMINRAEMTAEIIDQLRNQAIEMGLEDWENEMTSALSTADAKVFLAAYNVRDNYKSVVSALIGSGLNSNQLIKSYKQGIQGSSFTNKRRSPTLAGRTSDSEYKNLVYTPTTPCRIVSTDFASGETKSFYAHGNGSTMSQQGGDPGGCLSNGNSDAFAYVFNITVHHTARNGHIRIFPAHESGTITSIVNFINGSAVANSSVVKTSRIYGKDFKIYAARDAGVIVDVMGYFDKPKKTKPDVYITRSAKTSVIGRGTRFLRSPSCPSGYRLTSGGVSVDNTNIHIAASYPYIATGSLTGLNTSANRWQCRVTNTSATTHYFWCIGMCQRSSGQ